MRVSISPYAQGVIHSCGLAVRDVAAGAACGGALVAACLAPAAQEHDIAAQNAHLTALVFLRKFVGPLNPEQVDQVIHSLKNVVCVRVPTAQTQLHGMTRAICDALDEEERHQEWLETRYTEIVAGMWVGGAVGGLVGLCRIVKALTVGIKRLDGERGELHLV